MNDPLSPLSLSPSKPSPKEQWQELDSAQNIYHLTDKTFDAVLTQQKAALVLFYAPCMIYINSSLLWNSLCFFPVRYADLMLVVSLATMHNYQVCLH